LKTRYYPRRWGWRRPWRSHLGPLSGQPPAGVICPVFKWFFPAEIDQCTDYKYFNQQTHGLRDLQKVLSEVNPIW
jgi:hypothetical protein